MKRIALVSPDALSVLLFWKGLVRELKSTSGAEIVVVSDEGGRRLELEALGVHSRHVDMERFLDPVADLRYLARLTKILHRERCETVFLCCTKPNVYGAIAARLAGVSTVIIHVVGLGAAFVPGGGPKNSLVRTALKALYRVACGLSTSVWFTNTHDRDYFVSAGLSAARKTLVTRSYLDTDEYAPVDTAAPAFDPMRETLGIRQGDLVVVMVARLIWSKGIREFSQAAALLRDRYPHARFLLVAPADKGNLDPVPESYIRESERLANLTWLGFRQDVKSIYALADIAVLPSYYKEGGYPRALLEPMSMGKPIIASDSADCRGPVEHGRNGYVVPVRNARALASAIARLLDDPGLRAAFGAHSRAKAEGEFSELRILPDALDALGLSGPLTGTKV